MLQTDHKLREISSYYRYNETYSRNVIPRQQPMPMSPRPQTLMTDREWKPGIAASVDVTLLGRYYERFANHAVEVGRRVIFQTTDITNTSTRPRT
jgi:phosphate uptake regulator